MNLRGSYRKLLEHSKQAMIAAIEIYNKPKFGYREEIFSMLVTNAWELIILAILSKNKKRIYESKTKGQPYYQTLKFDDSIKQAEPFLPEKIMDAAAIRNIQSIRKYRNTAMHYYHDQHNKQGIYALAHASIVNYRDLLMEVFDQDIANEINIILLPLSFSSTPNFVEYFKTQKEKKFPPFIKELFQSLQELENMEGVDTRRLITQCTIKFEPTASINSADIIAGKSEGGEVNIVSKNVNPDHSHPFFQKDIIGDGKNKPKHRKLRLNINAYDFQALLWKYDIKNKPGFCWKSTKGGAPRYSQKIFHFLNERDEKDIDNVRQEYRDYMKEQKRRKKK